MDRLMRGLTFEQREAQRALAAEVKRLYEFLPMKAVAEQLGFSQARAWRLYHRQPLSEAQLAALAAARAQSAELAKQREAWRRRLDRQIAAERRQRLRDEAHETKAASLVCLIDAYEEMRPLLAEQRQLDRDTERDSILAYRKQLDDLLVEQED